MRMKFKSNVHYHSKRSQSWTVFCCLSNPIILLLVFDIIRLCISFTLANFLLVEVFHQCSCEDFGFSFQHMYLLEVTSEICTNNICLIANQKQSQNMPNQNACALYHIWTWIFTMFRLWRVCETHESLPHKDFVLKLSVRRNWIVKLLFILFALFFTFQVNT